MEKPSERAMAASAKDWENRAGSASSIGEFLGAVGASACRMARSWVLQGGLSHGDSGRQAAISHCRRIKRSERIEHLSLQQVTASMNTSGEEEEEAAGTWDLVLPCAQDRQLAIGEPWEETSYFQPLEACPSSPTKIPRPGFRDMDPCNMFRCI